MGNSSSKKSDLINIITYNTKLLSFSPFKCEKIINYLVSQKDSNFIICLQGVYNKDSIEFINNNITKHFEIDKTIPSIINECPSVLGLKIISSFPIYSFNYINFKDNNDILNIIDKNKKGILCSNIIIDNNIISIYNTNFQPDIKSILNCADIRNIQLDILIDFIKDNTKKLLEKNKDINFKVPRFNIVFGSFYFDRKLLY